MKKIPFLMLFLSLFMTSTILTAQNEPPDFPALFPGPVPNFNLTSGANTYTGTVSTPSDNQDAFSTTLGVGQTITSIVFSASGGGASGGSYQYGGMGAGTTFPGGTISSDPSFNMPGTYNNIISVGFSTGTNWSITINVVGGGGCTDPTVPVVSASPTTVCPGGAVTLSLTGTLNDATTWQWYSGSCGGTAIGTGTSITVNPTANTTYFARGEGGCVTPGSCGSVSVTATDSTPPTITCPGDITQSNDADVCSAVINYTTPLGTDNCSSTTTQTAGLPSGSTFPVGTTTNTFVVTDGAGLTATCSFDVIINDTEDPVITCPGDITQSNDAGVCGAVISYTTPVGTDNCSSTTTQTAGLPSGSTFPVGTTTNTFEVTDASGNTASCSFDVTVNDTENPMITCPANITQDNDLGDCGAVINYTAPTGTDNCAGSITTQTAGLPSGSSFPVGTTTNTFEVTDASGLTATCSFDVIINDTEDPVITCPGDITQSNDAGLCGAIVTFADPLISDNCSTSGVVTYIFTGSPEAFTVPMGVTEIEITAAGGKGGDGDGGAGGSGATMTGTFTVNPGDVLDVVVGNDGQQFGNSGGGGAGSGVILAGSPLIVAGGGGGASINNGGYPGLITEEGGNSSGAGGTAGNGGEKGYVSGDCGWASGGGGFLSDGYGGDGNWDGGAQPGTLSGSGAGSSWLNGGAGGTNGGCSFTYPNAGAWGLGGGGAGSYGGAGGGGYSGGGGGQYVDPITGYDAGGGGGSFNSGTNQTNTIGTNAGPGTITISYSAGPTLMQTAGLPSGSTFPVGTTTNTFVVTDGAGNTAICSFDVIVEDTEDPMITCPGDITQNNDPGVCGAAVTYAITSSDNCTAETLMQTAGIPSGGTFPVGTTTNTFVVTDTNGNTATCSFDVTIIDNELPVAVCMNIDVFLDGNGMATITPADVDGGSTDACGIASSAIDVTDFDCSNTGPNNVVLTVTDNNGNTSQCTAVVTVIDDLDPMIACPGDVMANVNPGQCSAIVTFPDALALDNCDVTVAQTAGLLSGSMFPVGTTTIEYTATDASGNTAVCTFDIIVTDNEPAMTVCQDITIDLDAAGNASITAADIDGGSSDNCGIATMIATPNMFTCADVGPNNVILEITDVNGNVSSCTAIVTVQDVTVPVVACMDITVELDPITGTVMIAGIDVDGGSTDACGIVSYDLDIDTFDCSNVGDNPVVLTVTDANGNVATCTAIVTVEDNAGPDLSCMDITVELDEIGMAMITPDDVIMTNTDACGIQTTGIDIFEFNCDDIGAPITVQIFSQDVNGNLASCTATVTVVDLLAPVITCPADQTVTVTAGTNYELPDYFVTGEATAVDNCTNPVTDTTQSPAAGTLLSVGTYTITMTATDEYGNTASCDFELTVDEVLGTNDNSSVDITSIVLYPNPARDFVNISNPQLVDLKQLSVYDLTGKLVLTQDLSNMGAEKTIDITNLQSATYMFILQSDNRQLTKQIIKE